MLIMTQTALYAVRDKYGYRPLVLGKSRKRNNWIVASETCCFDNTEYSFVRYIKPGEAIKIAKDDTSAIATDNKLPIMQSFDLNNYKNDISKIYKPTTYQTPQTSQTPQIQ